MSDTLNLMRRKKDACSKLRSVVRIMKIIAASQVRECQRSALASENYYRNITSALSAFFKKLGHVQLKPMEISPPPLAAIVFGTDQGLVGPFNDLLAKHVAKELEESREFKVFVIGERVGSLLKDLGVSVDALYPMPRLPKEIPSTIHELMGDLKGLIVEEHRPSLFLMHNRSIPGQLFEPTSTKILPLDEAWKSMVKEQAWPTKMIPEVLETKKKAVLALLREYLYAGFARSLAESMACENLVRFLSMQKAEKNIEETLTDLSTNINLVRHSDIDAELFDVISDFSALSEGANTQTI